MTESHAGLFSEAKRAALELLLRQRGIEPLVTDLPLVSIPRDKPHYQTSFGQQRIWFFDQYEPATAVYNVPLVLRLQGKVRDDLLQEAFQHVVSRHAILRTTFDHIDGALRQVVAGYLPIALKIIDLMSENEGERENLARHSISEEADRPFDLKLGPLVRAALVKLTEEDSFFVIVTHHAISDGWSMNVLIKDLGDAYEDLISRRELRPAGTELDYLDFAEWQMKWFDSGAVDKLLDFWTGVMKDAPLTLDIPSDFPRPPSPTFEGASVSVLIPIDLADSLAGLAREAEVTLFMLLLAAFDVFLMRYTGRQDVVVGTVMAGRSLPELEQMVGFFVNTVVLRSDLSGDPTFRELLTRVRRTSVDAIAHQDLPFERLIMHLDPPRDPSRSAVFQVVFALQNSFKAPDRFGDLKVLWEGIEATTAKFDLQIDFVETGLGLEASLTYRTDLFRRETITRMMDQMIVLMKSIVTDPGRRISQLEFMPQEERKRLMVASSARKVHPVANCLHEAFEVVAAARPDAAAISFGDEVWSYKKLDSIANRIANALIAEGIEVEDRVGIALERGPEMVAAIIGACKAGAAYLPLEVRNPRERLLGLIGDAGARVVIGSEKTSDLGSRSILTDGPALARFSDEPPLVQLTPDNLAYVIYTSGSTGTPKGVMVTHANLIRLFAATTKFDFGPSDVWTMFHSCAFDFSVWEMWGALLTGGRLVIVPSLVARDPAEFLDLLSGEEVTILNQTPSSFKQLMTTEFTAGAKSELSLRLVIFGGEALEPRSLVDWARVHPEVALVNMYGITETTVHVTLHPIGHGETSPGFSPVGVPLDDLSLYLEGPNLDLVPGGVPGEVFVGGPGVARGYIGRPDLTAERFVPDPFAEGDRLYRSGDLARWTFDENLLYEGRVDNQMKIRGFRIEPGEIESVLLDHSEVTEAVACLRAGDGTGSRLVAHVVCKGDAPVAELRAALKAKLPDYMIPSAIVPVDSIPLTPNGKVDVGALPDLEVERDSQVEYIPARNKSEEELAKIWQEVLEVGRVGVYDNFFDLGGSSFHAIQVVNRARAAGLEVSIKSLFQGQTVAESLGAPGPAQSRLGPDQRETGMHIPLLPYQAWFFEREPRHSHFYNEAVALETSEPRDPGVLREAFRLLSETHYSLRTTFPASRGMRFQRVVSAGSVAFDHYDLKRSDDAPAQFISKLEELHSSLDIETGPVARLARFDLPAECSRIVFIAHRLCVDAASWLILLEDFEDLCAQLDRHDRAEPPPVLTPMKAWADRLIDLSNSPLLHRELEYWTDSIPRGDVRFPLLDPGHDNVVGSSEELVVMLDSFETDTMLSAVGPASGAALGESLVAAAAAAFAQVLGKPLFVELENPERIQVFEGVDVSTTVGALTTLFPFSVDATGGGPPEALVEAVSSKLRSVPGGGLGYGVLRYMSLPGRELSRLATPEVRFHYFGDADEDGDEFGTVEVPEVVPVSPLGERLYEVEVEALRRDGKLEVHWTFQPGRHDPDVIRRLAESQLDFLRSLIRGAAPGEA